MSGNANLPIATPHTIVCTVSRVEDLRITKFLLYPEEFESFTHRKPAAHPHLSREQRSIQQFPKSFPTFGHVQQK
jgi:hypothetical protein